MEKIISAEISLFPIQSDNYKKDVDKAIEIIRSYNFKCEIGIFSTTIQGESSKIFDLINILFIELDKQTKFTLDIKISNICGCVNNSD